jgi:hypothetical protein
MREMAMAKPRIDVSMEQGVTDSTGNIDSGIAVRRWPFEGKRLPPERQRLSLDTVLVLTLIAVFVCSSPAASDSRFVLVTGFQSGNVVRFDLSTGAAENVIFLEPEGAPGTGDRPRGIAVDGAARIYVALRGGTQNVKRFTWTGSYIDDFTPSLGGFGPGQIGFSASGDLIVGGDVSGNSSVYRYDGVTGNLIDTFRRDGFQNVVGLLVDGDRVYSGSYFNGAIARYELSVTPVAGTTFIAADIRTRKVIGMTIGHTGNLLIASSENGAVQEYDIVTGAFVRTFLNFGVVDIKYDAASGRYFATASGNGVTELDQAGNATRVFQSPDLRGAYSVAIATVSGPTAVEATSWGKVKSLFTER